MGLMLMLRETMEEQPYTQPLLGQYEIAKLLIQNGADVGARNNEGETVINGTMADWETASLLLVCYS